jgi:hypothetical protein
VSTVSTRVASAALTLGALVAFLQFAERFYQPLADLSEKYNILQAAMASSERIFRLLDTESTVVPPAAGYRPPAVRGEVAFEHVEFEYKPGEPVLRGVSFRVEPGDPRRGRPYRRRQVDARQPAAALLRRQGRRGSSRRHDVRDWDLATLRRSVGLVLPGRLPLRRHDRPEHPPRRRNSTPTACAGRPRRPRRCPSSSACPPASRRRCASAAPVSVGEKQPSPSPGRSPSIRGC